MRHIHLIIYRKKMSEYYRSFSEANLSFRYKWNCIHCFDSLSLGFVKQMSPSPLCQRKKNYIVKSLFTEIKIIAVHVLVVYFSAMIAECTLKSIIYHCSVQIYSWISPEFLLNYSYKVSKSTKIIVVVDQYSQQKVWHSPYIPWFQCS